MSDTILHRAACITFLLVTATAPLVSFVSGLNFPGSNLGHLGIDDWQPRIGTIVIGQYLTATACMMLAWWKHPQAGPSAAAWILVTGVLARLILMPVYPYTSSDVERYLWDGRVALEGIDPYLVAPNSIEVAHLRADWVTPPEHAAVTTLYPPAAIASFALAAFAGPSYAWVAWKLLVGLASLGTLWLTVILLRSMKLSHHSALVALSPILVFELGIGGHVDGFSTLALTGALLAAMHSRPTLAGLLIGLGTLFKLLPILALAPLAYFWGRTRGTALLLCSAFMSVVGGYGLSVAFDMSPFGSTIHFFSNWRFGSPAFTTLTSDRPFVAVAGLLSVSLILGFIASIAYSRNRLAGWLQLVFIFALLLSPVIFPWYLCLLIPLIAIAPTAFLIIWTATLPVTYEVLNDFLATGQWHPSPWPLVIIALGFMAGLSWDWFRKAPHRVRRVC